MPLVLYSVNTYLAFMINERYYEGKHYVWCSEVFDARDRDRLGLYGNIPPTSNPYESIITYMRRSGVVTAIARRLRRIGEAFYVGQIPNFKLV